MAYSIKRLMEMNREFLDTAAMFRRVNKGVPNLCYLYFDMMRSRLLHGTSIADYFEFRFWNKSRAERLTFMTSKRSVAFYGKVNDPKRWLGYNHKAKFNRLFDAYLKRDWISLPQATEEEFVSFVQTHSPAFIKGCQAGWGEGIRKVYADEKTDLRALYQELKRDGGPYQEGFVVEQSIEQCDAMRSLHPASVNTARIVTFFNEREVKIMGAVLRVGSGSAYVDNHAAGGFSALIDTETGVVTTDGSGQGKINVKCHPDTGIPFVGFQVPEWDTAIRTVKETARMMPGIHYVGWDVAFLKDGGVCLIECNPTADADVLQEPTQIGVRALFDRMLSELEANRTK